MSSYIIKNGTLIHFGIKGQKWGERRWQNPDGSLTPEGRIHYGYLTKRENAKNEYKKAKQNVKDKYALAGTKVLAGSEARKRLEAYDKSEINLIRKKAEYNAAKKKDLEKAKKAEFNTYKREMKKSGIQGSIKDAQTRNRSSRLYDDIVKNKGKAYADKVEKKVKDEAIATAAVAGAAYVAVMGYYLYELSKY